MSHFSTIKTKLKCKESLVSALNTLGHEAQENTLLVNQQGHDHKQWNVCVALNEEIGFKLNKNTGEYELVAELDAWDLNVPVSRFIDKLTQQYAIEKLKRQTAEEGYVIENQQKNINGSVELIVSRWVLYIICMSDGREVWNLMTKFQQHINF